MSAMNKIKTNKRWIVAGALVGVLALAGTATAGGFGGRGFPMMRVLRHLDLTEAQEVQAVRMRRALREQHKAARARMEATMERVKAELAKPDPDPQVLHGAVDQMTEQMKSGLHAAVNEFLKLHKTMSAEQREKMVEIMDHVKERRRRHRPRFDD